ncbi:uncharacterized protein [Montipora capricornis]|uniref:uncharacterized protein n=1 Tax=Montipora capricornis TaxID=246305 RepID=UPI0035F14445
MALEEEVVRIICVYGPQSGRTGAEKERFYDDLRSEWDLHNMGELVLGMGDFNGHVGKRIERFEGVHGGNGVGERNVEGKMLKGEKRKVTYSAGENETEIDFVLVEKGNRKYLKDAKVIPGELQHRLVVTDLVKKKVVRKKAIERRKERVLKACDEVCGKKKGRRDQGDTWWWNEDVNEAIVRKKDEHKEMCERGNDANKARYKNMKNRAKRWLQKQ